MKPSTNVIFFLIRHGDAISCILPRPDPPYEPPCAKHVVYPIGHLQTLCSLRQTGTMSLESHDPPQNHKSIEHDRRKYPKIEPITQNRRQSHWPQSSISLVNHSLEPARRLCSTVYILTRRGVLVRCALQKTTLVVVQVFLVAKVYYRVEISCLVNFSSKLFYRLDVGPFRLQNWVIGLHSITYDLYLTFLQHRCQGIEPAPVLVARFTDQPRVRALTIDKSQFFRVIEISLGEDR